MEAEGPEESQSERRLQLAKCWTVSSALWQLFVGSCEALNLTEGSMHACMHAYRQACSMSYTHTKAHTETLLLCVLAFCPKGIHSLSHEGSVSPLRVSQQLGSPLHGSSLGPALSPAL